MDNVAVNLLKLSGCLVIMLALQGVFGTASERRTKRRRKECTDDKTKEEDTQ